MDQPQNDSGRQDNDHADDQSTSMIRSLADARQKHQAKALGTGEECGDRLDMATRRELVARLARLEQEHRDLDDSITALERAGTFELLQVRRQKKRKLALKDEIAYIRARLVPDIIA